MLKIQLWYRWRHVDVGEFIYVPFCEVNKLLVLVEGRGVLLVLGERVVNVLYALAEMAHLIQTVI